MNHQLMSPKYFNAFLPLSVVAHLLIPITRIIDAPYTYLGFAFVALGIGVNFLAARSMAEAKTTSNFYGLPQRFVVTGAFRASRNPIYLGGVILLLGIAILLGSLIAFLFPIALFIILDRLYIPSEERRLEQAFGRDFLDYKRTVRKWI